MNVAESMVLVKGVQRGHLSWVIKHERGFILGDALALRQEEEGYGSRKMRRDGCFSCNMSGEQKKDI